MNGDRITILAETNHMLFYAVAKTKTKHSCVRHLIKQNIHRDTVDFPRNESIFLS